ncbi:hypothetical protein Salat_2362900 [Sesamum alatum]|uniref:Uncharacterized protein n=1 Tax=Sesamum alatum TaxID=300844 RepID=A0AAE1XWW4_9LAMI|nr:hypothetical protein Salat_2362900 [Sesamum alatum]
MDAGGSRKRGEGESDGSGDGGSKRSKPGPPFRFYVLYACFYVHCLCFFLFPFCFSREYMWFLAVNTLAMGKNPSPCACCLSLFKHLQFLVDFKASGSWEMFSIYGAVSSFASSPLLFWVRI